MRDESIMKTSISFSPCVFANWICMVNYISCDVSKGIPSSLIRFLSVSLSLSLCVCVCVGLSRPSAETCGGECSTLKPDRTGTLGSWHMPTEPRGLIVPHWHIKLEKRTHNQHKAGVHTTSTQQCQKQKQLSMPTKTFLLTKKMEKYLLHIKTHKTTSWLSSKWT